MWSSILRSIRSGIRVGLVLLVLPASANAQSGAGSGLSGRVTDISGAPMAGVTITPSRGRRWRGANSDHEYCRRPRSRFVERERRHVQHRPLRDHARRLWMALSVHSWSSSRTTPHFNSKNRSGREESRV